MHTYICKICKKAVEDGAPITMIQSGSLLAEKNDIKPPSKEQRAFVFYIFYNYNLMPSTIQLELYHHQVIFAFVSFIQVQTYNMN